MDASLLLILYAGLLFALRGVAPPPVPSGRFAGLLWHLIGRGWWPHGALLHRDAKAKWVVGGWMVGSFLLGRASLFAPHSPLAYSLEQLGGLAAGLSLLAGFLTVALLLRSRAETAKSDEREPPPPARALVALRKDEGMVRLAGYPAQAVRRLAPQLYVMPGEAVALLEKERVLSVAPWPPELDAVEGALRALQEKLLRTEEQALALGMEKNRACEALLALEGKLDELELARRQLVQDIARMRAESRLGSQSEFYRLSDAELIQSREVRQREILLIEQILEVRHKASPTGADLSD